MKRIFLSVIISLLFITGCAKQESACPEAEKPALTKNNKFPDYIAGTWKSGRKTGWQLTFTKEGNIEKIVHTTGRVEMKPGEVTKVPMKMEGISVYEPGEWTLDYNAQTGELRVKIALDFFYAQIGPGTVEGSRVDIFTGKPAKDGIWKAEWVSMPNYTATTEEHGRVKLSKDSEETVRSITFKK